MLALLWGPAVVPSGLGSVQLFWKSTQGHGLAEDREPGQDNMGRRAAFLPEVTTLREVLPVGPRAWVVKG